MSFYSFFKIYTIFFYHHILCYIIIIIFIFLLLYLLILIKITIRGSLVCIRLSQLLGCSSVLTVCSRMIVIHFIFWRIGDLLSPSGNEVYIGDTLSLDQRPKGVVSFSFIQRRGSGKTRFFLKSWWGKFSLPFDWFHICHVPHKLNHEGNVIRFVQLGLGPYNDFVHILDDTFQLMVP